MVHQTNQENDEAGVASAIVTWQGRKYRVYPQTLWKISDLLSGKQVKEDEKSYEIRRIIVDDNDYNPIYDLSEEKFIKANFTMEDFLTRHYAYVSENLKTIEVIFKDGKYYIEASDIT